MKGIGSEGIAFLQALLAGMIVYSVYLCVRKLRRVIRHSLTAVAIEDALFWLATAIYLFVQIYHTSDGSIRWNFVLGVVLGTILTSIMIMKAEKLHKKISIWRRKDFS